MKDDLNTAVDYHRRGLLDQAAQIYQGLLDREPAHPDALHLLGVVVLQQGRPLRAVELISRAVALKPTVAAFHGDLGEAYRTLGQLEPAVDCCRKALQLQPNFPEAANNLGLALLALGRTEEARRQFREALRLQPRYAMACNNLANALRLQGDTGQALAHFRQAVQLDPAQAEARTNLGQLLLEHYYQRQEALAHCREAVRLRPGFPEAQNNLGNVLRELGRLDEAKACYAEALRLNPGLAMTYNNMGQASQEESKLADALSWYQHALQRDPNSARIQCNVASVLEELERHDEAIARYELALRLDPSYAEAYSGLGWVRHEQGRFQEAKALYQRALELRPNLAEALCSLGTVQEELNDFAAAERHLREALRLDPGLAGAHVQLATMLRGKLPEPDLDALRQIAAHPDLSASKRSALQFGLALVLDARGAYDEAALHLRQANAARLAEWRAQGKGYDPAEHAQFVAGLMATCTPDYFARVRSFGLETERPIFIVGLPRSGTTLTEQILASHSQVFGAGELRLARDTFSALPAVMNREALPLECLGRIDAEAARRLAEGHRERLQELDEQALRVADKMPDNYLYLGLLATLFPRAKFIHCRRDLRDIAVSCWMTNFRHIHWASDPEQIASRFRAYRRLMEHWRSVLPVPVLEVDYEETVADLEGVARRLVAWCGLEWEPACLAFHEGTRPVRTASVMQVRQPIYTHAVARWKHYEQALAPLWTRLECD
jgi:tetratricopeptide (TPR) repeat protein